MTRCPHPGCGGVLLQEPDDLPINYRGASGKRLPGWVLRCSLCAREYGQVERALPRVAERRLKW